MFLNLKITSAAVLDCPSDESESDESYITAEQKQMNLEATHANIQELICKYLIWSTGFVQQFKLNHKII